MRILPPTPVLPSQPIVRRHYRIGVRERLDDRSYLPCLRWEFGFSCAFCLLHEADLSAGRGADGWGMFWVEHFAPKSHYPDKADSYENLFYVCRFCSQARGAIPLTSPDGGRLLNPCEVAWADYFRFDNDRIIPLQDDPDASYTIEAFDLNDHRKLAARRFRRSAITRSLDALVRARELRDRLLDQPGGNTGTEHVEVAQVLDRMASFALGNLFHFSAIPEDASTACSCGFAEQRELPAWLDEQVLEIDESALAGPKPISPL